MCCSRYAVGKDGRTVDGRLRGTTCEAVVVPMEEKVWYNKIRVGIERKNKADTEWHTGIGLGQAAISSEALIGTPLGVVRASAIKRFEEAEKWDMQAVLEMKGDAVKAQPRKAGAPYTHTDQTGTWSPSGY